MHPRINKHTITLIKPQTYAPHSLDSFHLTSPHLIQVGSAIAAVKANPTWLYSRSFGVGLFTLLK